MENVPCLKAQISTAGRGTSVFAFLLHLNFMYTRSVVPSKHQDFHTEKLACQAVGPCLIIQQFSPSFVISCLHSCKLCSAFDPVTGKRTSLLSSTQN